MLKKGLAAIATLFLSAVLVGCGGGSGRQGTDVVASAAGPAVNVPGGSTAAFIMTVRNAGPNTAQGVSVTNVLSNQLIPVSVTCTASGGATCPAEPTLIMPVPDLPAGGALELTVNVQLTANASGNVSNTMTVNATDDTDRTNNTASFSAVAVSQSSDLVVAGTGPSGTVAAGSDADFVVTVRNDGPDAATNLAFVNNTGSFVVLRSVECSASGGGTCPATLGVNMALDSLPAGATLTFTVHTTISAGVNGTVTNTFNATADTDTDRSDNSVTLTATVAATQDLSVTQNGAATTAAGSTAVFNAVLTNSASSAATGITITSAVTATDGAVDLSALTITCTPVGGATCPATLGPTMTVDSLAAGRSLNFTISLPVPAAARGSVQSVFSISAAGDGNAANNQATTTTTVFDPRNGSYKVFAGDGRQYALSIDFDARSYTMTVGTQAQQRSFTADTSGGGFTVSGAQRLRTATDLVVGGHDFGAGVLPYVAARTFGSTVSEVVGSYNMVVRDFPGNVAKTHAAVVSVVGNQMLVCQTDDGSIKPPGSACTTAGKQRNYTLTAGSGNLYTATEVGGQSEVFTFMLARSDASKLIVAAPSSSSATPILRIALQDAPTLIGGSFKGASTSGSWVDPLSISGATLTVTGGSADSGTTTVAPVAQTGVGSLQVGNRGGDSTQRLWVMQASPLALSFGDAGASGSVAGLLQITVP